MRWHSSEHQSKIADPAHGEPVRPDRPAQGQAGANVA